MTHLRLFAGFVLSLVIPLLAQADPAKPESIMQLFEAGTKLRKEGKLAESQKLLEKALAVKERVPDGSPPTLAEVLRQLGAVYLLQSQLLKSKQTWDRAAQLIAKNQPGSLVLAMAYHDLAIVNQELSDFDHAEEYNKKALEIRLKQVGPEAELTGDSLMGLGNVAYDKQDYASAEHYYNQADKVFSKNPGPLSTKFSDIKANLGNIFGDMWRFHEAELAYSMSLKILQTQAVDSFAIKQKMAIVYLNLASLSLDKGDLKKSIEFSRRSAEINTEILGKSNRMSLKAMSMLAIGYSESGNHDQASKIQEDVLEVRKKTLPSSHPDIFSATRDLGSTRMLQGRYQEALRLLMESLRQRKKTHKKAIDNITILYDIAQCYMMIGEFHQAARMIDRIIYNRKILSPNTISDALGLKAYIQTINHRANESSELFMKSIEISENIIKSEVPYMSPAALRNFALHMSEERNRILSAVRIMPTDARLREIAVSFEFLRNSRLIESEKDLLIPLASVPRAQDPRLQRMRELRVQISNGVLASSSESAKGKEWVASRLAELHALEEELSKSYAEFSSHRMVPAPRAVRAAVEAQLPQDSALVEFVEYTVLPYANKSADEVDRTVYAALIIRKGHPTAYVEIGSKSEVDHEIQQFILNVSSQDATGIPPSSSRLYQRLWGPLARHVTKASRVTLVPDGTVSLVPFEALHNGAEYLADRHAFQYLATGRDLLPRRPTSEGAKQPSLVYVFADPAFQSQPTETLTLSGPTRLREARLTFAQIPALPGTRQEAAAIKQLIPQANVFLGTEANEARMLRLQSPAILHIATHGFYLSASDEIEDGRGLQLRRTGTPQDPLLRSMLALAGAARPASPDGQDGLLTALELSSMNLWGTQLVVMSACNSGLGEVRREAGIYGLRRAALIAGAETLVTSLWKVDDGVTRDLMAEFYKNLLSGTPRVEAMRQAALAIRGKQPHPRYWAPFIVIGRDGPLRGISTAQPTSQGLPKAH